MAITERECIFAVPKAFHMIEIIPELPHHVAAFRATGTVTKEDYETVLIPHVDYIHKTFGQINFLLWLDTDVGHYTVGAWVDDAFLGLKHLTHWHKIAIVSHQEMVTRVANILGHIIPGETRGFAFSELPDAMRWISIN